MTIIDERKVVTRKEHQCFACLKHFPKGTELTRQTNTYDGIGSVYWCDQCGELFKTEHDALLDPFDNTYPDGCVHEMKLRGE